jgi:hypothetical protein
LLEKKLEKFLAEVKETDAKHNWNNTKDNELKSIGRELSKKINKKTKKETVREITTTEQWSYEKNMAFWAGVIDKNRPLILLTDIAFFGNDIGGTHSEILWLKNNGYTFKPNFDNPNLTDAVPPIYPNTQKTICDYGLRGDGLEGNKEEMKNEFNTIKAIIVKQRSVIQEEKEKKLISLLQARLQIPQLQPVGVIQQQITGASQGIPISQPVEVKISTSLSPAFQSRQEVEQSQVDSKQQTQQWPTLWLEFYRSMTLEQQEKTWDALDQSQRKIAFSLLSVSERLQVLGVDKQKNTGAQGIEEISSEIEPAPSRPLFFRQNSPLSLGQSSSYYLSSSSTLFSSSSSSSSSSLSRSEPTSTPDNEITPSTKQRPGPSSTGK